MGDPIRILESDVALPITEEVRQIHLGACSMAARSPLSANHLVSMAADLLDATIELVAIRVKVRQDAEAKRRRGY